MTFIILGAGAIGCYIGGRLASAGNKTVLVGRPHTLRALAAGGLRVSDQEGFDAQLQPDQLHLCGSLREAMEGLDPATGSPTIFVCVKGTGTDEVARDIAQCCAPGTVVISMQNGLDNAQRIHAIAQSMQVHAGMVPYTVMWRNEHHVHRANGGVLQMQRSAATQALTATMAAAGVPVELHDDMPAVQWGKLLLNLMNPVNALADIPIREQLLQRDFRLVFAALQTEALGVLRAANIQPAKVAAVAPAMVPRILSLPDWLFIRIAAGMLKTDPGAKTSMCVDLRNGRPTEIDDLCGAVVRLAQLHSVKAPLNSIMVELITHYQAGKHWSGPSLRRALRI
jgi:2-dehydropantoate 2-reductase